ncbi:MAG TPA: hypothetical protein VEW28_04645 [Candidatus Kapabacteria bacterium]|nr:hypothetical protein [Candidatus Kapabacteria bacterium]
MIITQTAAPIRRFFVSTLMKWIVVLLITTFLSNLADAQWENHEQFVPVWMPSRGSFLEPNRFATVADASRNRLRLEAGFGMETLQIGSTSIGAEGLIWSGLKSLSGFRFPVETADYFFGLYSVFPIPFYPFGGTHSLSRGRFRIAHISSHLVDGTQDSVVGGASSRFSREFMSIENEYGFDYGRLARLRVSVGVKYVFHQVTNIEPTIQFPVSIDYIPFHFSTFTEKDEWYITISDAGSAYYPQYSAALTYRLRQDQNSVVELYGEYHTGATRYGVEGSLKEHGFEFGIRLAKVPVSGFNVY